MALIESGIDLSLSGIEHGTYRKGCPREVHGKHGQGGKAGYWFSCGQRQSLDGGDADPQAGEGAWSESDSESVQIGHSQSRAAEHRIHAPEKATGHVFALV